MMSDTPTDQSLCADESCATVLSPNNHWDICYRHQAIAAYIGRTGSLSGIEDDGFELDRELFVDSIEVAYEVTWIRGRRTTEEDVEAILGSRGYSYYSYNLDDVEVAVGALGGLQRSTRPIGNQLDRLCPLIEAARAKLVSSESLKATWDELNTALDSFLEVLMPGITHVVPGTQDWGIIRIADSADVEEQSPTRTLALTPEEYGRSIDLMDARDAVLSSLESTADSIEGWRAVSDCLTARFPNRLEQPATRERVAQTKDAFFRLCMAQRDRNRADREYLKYWREARRITGELINRSRRGNRLMRQLYIEELVFNNLWLGTPISEQDLNLHREKIKHAAWDSARRALYKAAESMPPPRKFKPLIRAAHKLLGGSSYRNDPDCRTFVRFVKRRVSGLERQRLLTDYYESVRFTWGNGTAINPSDLQKFIGDDELI